MDDDDMVYLLRRAEQERRLAVAAVNEEARIIHLSLADAYAERAGGNRLASSSQGTI